jgi:hypothetical protein
LIPLFSTLVTFLLTRLFLFCRGGAIGRLKIGDCLD